ncbi:MAG: HAMP domain-containing protein [Burkholderiales bacterium]|nr:HAMP domain-containing protein [Burkholderiales bacterium]
MRLLPRSLLWRTFAVIALLLVVSVLAWIQIFRFYEREPRGVQIAQQVAAIVNLTRAALVSSRPDARAFLMREISASERIEIYAAEPDETIERGPDTPGIRRIEALIRAKTGADTRIAFRRNGTDGMWVSFRIEDDEYWVRLRRDRLAPPVPLHWFGWGALTMAVALFGAYLLVRRITRPLRALAAAAADVGRGRRPAPLPEGGASEVAEVTRAFNQMARDLDLQERNRALILAGISHDLRTPLARLRLGVEMSTDAGLRDGMVADIEQMDQVIGQFLDFARTGEDDSAARTAVDAAALCRQLVEHSAGLGRTILLEAGTGIPPLPGRPAALRRALANLVENAFKYGGAAPQVSLALRAEGPDLVIEVRDRGPGIPPADAERLKQPFTRRDDARGSADGSVDSAQGGAGLGLAIVDRIARQHGGTLDLLPRDGGGLVARLRLPLAAQSRSTASTTS